MKNSGSNISRRGAMKAAAIAPFAAVAGTAAARQGYRRRA